MISAAPKSRLFEEHQIPTEGPDVLYATLMFPKPPNCPKRLVFIPPLIGAGASQPLIIFRNLTRRGAVLLSFEYRGHSRSSGTFELDRTITDVRHALDWAANYARQRGLPLHGFATCFGVIALAAQYAAGGRRRRLWSFNTISGLFRLDHILRFEDFAAVFSRRLGVELDTAGLLEGIAGERFDWSGDAFRGALEEYLSTLFPELDVGRDHFEELHYGRVNIPRTLQQLARARYLDGLAIPRDLRCTMFFGRNDDVLSLHTREGREAYCSHVRSLVPHAELHECEIDHFGRGPDHDPVIDRLADIFEECEAQAVPVCLPAEGVPIAEVRA